MRFDNKIVEFQFCKFCEHRDKSEIEEPCDECLDNPVNINSQRPVRFKDNGSLALYLKKHNKGE